MSKYEEVLLLFLEYVITFRNKEVSYSLQCIFDNRIHYLVLTGPPPYY